MMTPKILFQDQALVAAVKPQGILSQPDRTGAPAMTDLLAGAVECPVFSVHRLDRGVGGVMVYALTKAAAGKLSAGFGGDSFRKEYLTVIDGVPKNASGTLEDYLFHDQLRNMTSVVPQTARDAKQASLSYEVLDTKENVSLVRVQLHTGRTHQIRVQFASRGMPILGDGKYGSRARHEIALWSYRLSFSHPLTKKQLTFHALPEVKTPWDAFDLTKIFEERSKSK